MGLLPHLKIAQKLPLALVGSALLVSVGVGIASYLIGSATVDSLSQRQIKTIATQTSAELQSYLEGVAKDLTITSATESTQTILRDLNITWGQFLTGSLATDPVVALQTAYITNNPDPAQRELLDVSTADKRTNYDFTHSKIHPAFRRQLQARGYADLMLIDPTGNLIYSVKKPDWAGHSRQQRP
jgi:methyl-accepting chemotaxis protein